MRRFLVVLLFAAGPAGFAQLAPGLIPTPAPANAPGSAPANPPAPAVPPAASPASVASSVAPVPHSISLDVKLVRSGGGSNMNQGSGTTGVGTTRTSTTNSREREKQTQLQLEVNLRNFAQRPDQVTVDWTFFSEYVDENTAYGAKQEKEKDPLRILSNGSQEVAFKPGGSEKLNVESAKATLFETRSSTVSTTRVTSSSSRVGVSNHAMKLGHKAAGWLVRVKADGKILAVKASAPRFENWPRTTRHSPQSRRRTTQSPRGSSRKRLLPRSRRAARLCPAQPRNVASPSQLTRTNSTRSVRALFLTTD